MTSLNQGGNEQDVVGFICNLCWHIRYNHFEFKSKNEISGRFHTFNTCRYNVF